jgi:hypothetical protein
MGIFLFSKRYFAVIILILISHSMSFGQKSRKAKMSTARPKLVVGLVIDMAKVDLKDC